MKKQIRIYIYIIGLILIDQLSKVWALSALRGTEGIAVIPNVFELSYLENRGAAFGILQDHQIFFVLITVAAAVILTWIYRRIPQTKKYIPLRISYALIMAGAFGNLIDYHHLTISTQQPTYYSQDSSGVRLSSTGVPL